MLLTIAQVKEEHEIRNWLNLTGNFGFAQIVNNRSINQTINSYFDLYATADQKHQPECGSRL